MVESQDGNDKEKNQRRAEETDKLKNFSHAENGAVASGTAGFASGSVPLRRRISPHARGTFPAAQAMKNIEDFLTLPQLNRDSIAQT